MSKNKSFEAKYECYWCKKKYKYSGWLRGTGLAGDTCWYETGQYGEYCIACLRKPEHQITISAGSCES